MNIDTCYPDNYIVAKYGMTKNLEQRTKEHLKDYGKIKNVELKLKYYTYIDPQYISDGETDISDYFKNGKMMFSYDNRSELVMIDPTNLKKIEKQYTIIYKLYAGHITDLMVQIKNLEKELLLQKQTHTNELLLIKQVYITELYEEKANVQEEKAKVCEALHNNEILKKDMEIKEFEMKLLKIEHKIN
jgi:antitoxin component YwqK of YwqJK toxin-antitoxin module